jgi:hypothetical protein
MPSPERSLPALFPYASNIVTLIDPLARPHGAAGTKVALVGTYSPRQCGLATFTTDVHQQLVEHQPDLTIDVYALDDADGALAYGEDITATIAQQDPASYAATAERINRSGASAVWLQHEFGIFGGPDGEMICDFVDRIAAPLIFTFHTVLAAPSERQRRIMEHLLSRASRVMVMSDQGRQTVISVYDAPAELIRIIPHGAPARPFGGEQEC